MLLYHIYQSVDLANHSNEWVQIDTAQHEESAIDYARKTKELYPTAKLSIVKCEETEIAF